MKRESQDKNAEEKVRGLEVEERQEKESPVRDRIDTDIA